jgi:NAD(P)-dependent dehydrogenase (short-subunit alcohol dehydrogenase family)
VQVIHVSSSDLSNFDLRGKRALVTGGAGGIGKACAIGMAKAGADVAVVDLKIDMGMETADQIRGLGRKSTFIRCDVSEVDAVEAMVAEVLRSLGGLDIALNNAGIGGGLVASIDDKALATWDRVLATNLSGVFYCCRAEAKHMIKQGFGKIVNTASINASVIANTVADVKISAGYFASKAGVKHLTKALAVEWAGHNICVNSVSPGFILTPMTDAVDAPELLAQEILLAPMHRPGEAEELVGAVLYLASDASSFTTGADLIVDGGHTIW